eukprot:9277289-Pyramimonas_sp.AAC.1
MIRDCDILESEPQDRLPLHMAPQGAASALKNTTTQRTARRPGTKQSPKAISRKRAAADAKGRCGRSGSGETTHA